MKNIFFLLLSELFFLTACSQNTGVIQINAIEFDKLVNQGEGIVLLDVRTLDEFKNGHIAHSGQLNYYDSDFKKRLLLLPKDEPIFLYCNTGWRSKKAAQILTENGYKKIYNLEHGIMEWNLENLPVVVEPDATPDVENKMEPDEFAALLNSGQPVLIDFYAPWCGPCRKMMPMIDSLKTENDDKISIVKVNVDASKKLMKEMGIVSVPYLVIYQKEKVLFSHYGLISQDELSKILNSNLSSLQNK
jgi:thioredoxin